MWELTLSSATVQSIALIRQHDIAVNSAFSALVNALEQKSSPNRSQGKGRECLS